jgi:phosphoglycerate dehydrogenase-like enzyme
LFPELVESQIVLTNGRGVFGASLGEFVLAAILYLANDFPRMVRQPDGSGVGTVRRTRESWTDGHLGLSTLAGQWRAACMP